MKIKTSFSKTKNTPQRNTALAIYMLSVTLIVVSYSIVAAQIYL